MPCGGGRARFCDALTSDSSNTRLYITPNFYNRVIHVQ